MYLNTILYCQPMKSIVFFNIQVLEYSVMLFCTTYLNIDHRVLNPAPGVLEYNCTIYDHYLWPPRIFNMTWSSLLDRYLQYRQTDYQSK